MQQEDNIEYNKCCKKNWQLMYNICNTGFGMCRSTQLLETHKGIEKGKHPAERAEQNPPSVPGPDEN